MTMKEVCEYVKTTRIAEAKKHRMEVTKGDLCSGLTESEYNKMRTRVKGAGSRGRKHAHTDLWRHNDLESVYKIKFDW